jgi:hypothetical protein
VEREILRVFDIAAPPIRLTGVPVDALDWTIPVLSQRPGQSRPEVFSDRRQTGRQIMQIVARASQHALRVSAAAPLPGAVEKVAT